MYEFVNNKIERQTKK